MGDREFRECSGQESYIGYEVKNYMGIATYTLGYQRGVGFNEHWGLKEECILELEQGVGNTIRDRNGHFNMYLKRQMEKYRITWGCNMCTEDKQEEVKTLYELVRLPKERLKHHSTINNLSKEVQVYIKGLEFKDNDVVDNKDLHENIMGDLHYLLEINRDKFSKEEYVTYIDKSEIEDFEEFAVKVSLDNLYEETLEEYVTLLLIRQQLIDGNFGSVVYG